MSTPTCAEPMSPQRIQAANATKIHGGVHESAESVRDAGDLAATVFDAAARERFAAVAVEYEERARLSLDIPAVAASLMHTTS